jgi:hypothetical protein
MQQEGTFFGGDETLAAFPYLFSVSRFNGSSQIEGLE